MFGRPTLGAVSASFLAAVLMAGCGSTTKPTTTNSSTTKPAQASKSAAGVTAKVTLAPLAAHASQLCAKPPANPALTVRMNGMGTPQVKSSDVALQVINENAPGSDGPFVPASVDNTPVDEPMAGTNANGQPLSYGEVYFSTNGALPAGTQNVMLCAEVYDGLAGNTISAQFSGDNTAGPVNGAYDAAPEAYLTSGSKKFTTISFDFSGIAFAKGGAGVGKENGGADFRINIDPITQGAVYIQRVWLVTSGVPVQASLAAAPAPTPLGSGGGSKASGTLSLNNCTPAGTGSQWKVVSTNSKTPPTFTVPTGTPTVGGSLGSWPSKPMVQMGDCKTTEVWAYTMADSKNLYLAVKVQSVYPAVAGTDSAPWAGDVVQFAVDGADDRANHPGNPGGYDTADDTEAGMMLLNGKSYIFSDVAPTGESTAMPPTNIPGAQVAITRSNGVTLYEGAIPLSYLHITPGHTFGFNIAASAGGPPYAAPYGFEWTHGIIGTKWPYAFAQLVAH